MQLNLVFRAILSLVILSASSVASARDLQSGTIEAVRPDNWDVGGFFIRVSGTLSGTQSCSSPDGGAYNYYFITKNNPLMKELLSAALSAKLAGMTVTIVGSGGCEQGYEDVKSIQIN